MKYWIRRKYRQIKNLIRWSSVIWKLYDYDYQSSLEVFTFQLKNIAEFLESDKAYSMSAKDDAKRIRTILKLYDKTFGDEDYSLEYFKQLEDIYGKDVLKFHFVPAEELGEGFNKLEVEYESWDNVEEVDKKHEELRKKARIKQEKAERLFWELLHRNIKRFWD